MVDFVTTMRSACEPKCSAFTWPKQTFTLVNAFSVALTHLPPGYMVSVRNAAPIPIDLQRPSDLKKTPSGPDSGTLTGEATGGPSGGLPMGEAAGAFDPDEEMESAEDSESEAVRNEYKQKEPAKASSMWAGKYFSPWWWLGEKPAQGGEEEEQEK